MRRTLLKRAVTAAVAAAALTTGLHAYTTYAKWAAGSATFFVNPANADVSQSAALDALYAGMNVWNTQSGSAFRFYYGGPTSATSLVNDGRNVVFFRNSTSGSAIATTYSWWDGNGRLLDSDIVFWDAAFAFFTDATGCGGVSNAAYIEDVSVHEFGHALGLNHSSVSDATMYPSYGYCSQEFRTLAADDIAAARSLYPGASQPPPPPPANTAPTVVISSPGNGASVAEGTTVSFGGSASDTEDGNLTPWLQWTDNGNAIGSGGSFSKVLTVGTHTIAARVGDSGGLQASKSVSITVTSTTQTGSTPAKGRNKKR